ncbi:hypothetical protein SLNWT_7123 [Streptomyces albus]|uniref:GAF domain-containing protein n=1 Tax=Streptomyces albus (strain ATCC 21838 / DSM 41398 / FERM P-419 / JCM 4703 / NBRC 107858) TaxID=1081613 RepID=A0A0B5F095_STRA4|nr:hypothetical protein SLNWT_7123 [Streptomyces albus]AOU81803.1 hypothetical protein SLNHY_7112 [Streptomyces albus]AYN37490.1 hypothetical protein DUI70_6997 [Streptomyces albus]
MTYPYNGLHPAQADPSTGPLPRRTKPQTAHGLVVPGGAAVPGPQPQPHQDAELALRYELLEHLGISTSGSPEFDELARALCERTGFLYGFVNVFLEQQTLIGLHQPPANSGHVTIGRTMSRDHGWCPHVVTRRKAFPLHDVHASPRFSANPVVYQVRIRSYFGAPLIHVSGVVLGTVGVIDPEPRPLDQARKLRDLVIAGAHQAMPLLTR